MTMQLGGVTIDCRNPRQLAMFWTAALDYAVVADHEGEFVFLSPAGAAPGEGTYVGLQRVDEPRTGKNRAHPDFHVEDRAAEVARLQELGATLVGEHEVPGLFWTVLQDPEGNEFCVGSHTG